MPTTFNGIGTHYYGKKNLTTSHARCEHCGHEGELESYDTILFFVLLFVPIIPLGKKRVIDYCTQCDRHRVMDASEYHDLVEEELTERAAAERQQPKDPGAAVAHNSALVEFGRSEDALVHLGKVVARFPSDARVQLYASSVYERFGRAEESDRCLDRAYQLEPEDPVIRRARAIQNVQQGNPQAALRLLETMAAEHVDPGALFLVARTFQKHDEHHRALEVFRLLQERFPDAAQDRHFRRAVLLSEKQVVMGTPSILPDRRPFRRWIASLTAVIVLILLVAGGLAVMSWNARKLHTIHIVNAVPEPITIQLSSGATERLNGPGLSRIYLPAGARTVTITGAIEESFEIEVADSGFWGFLRDDPVYVINPGGMAVLIRETAVYSQNPEEGSQGTFKVLAGNRFEALPPADYVFERLPEEISTSSGSKHVTRSGVDRLVGGPEQVYAQLLGFGSIEDRFAYLDSWLPHVASDELILGYAEAALATGRAERAQQRLRELLSFDPVNVEWHRAYQQLGSRTQTGHAALIAEYDVHLAAHPESSDLLYLRGRLSLTPDEARGYCRRALAADRNNVHAYRSLAYQLIANAQFERARSLLEQVRQRQLNDRRIDAMYHDVLFAGGDFTTLEQELRERVRVDGEVDWELAERLLNLLLRTGRQKEAARMITEICIPQSQHAALETFLRCRLLYATGAIPKLENLIEEMFLPAVWKSDLELWVALEQGNVVKATNAVARIELPGPRGVCGLLLFLMHWRSGDAGRADEALEAALNDLAEAGPEFRTFGDLVRGERPLGRNALDELAVDCTTKRAMLATLAARFPQQRKSLLAEAERFDLGPAFPHRFLSVVIQ